jgi:MOSC domain-containing protein YiiM
MAIPNNDFHGTVVAVSLSETHSFMKTNRHTVRLVEGFGVEGDAHGGATVKHRSRVSRDATRPNLRQVHLIHAELFDELAEYGFDVAPGALGENLTTRGIRLLELPTGARLRIGGDAVIELTGLRNPCVQIERFKSGLLARVVARGEAGELVRRAGVMSIVVQGGVVSAGDGIVVELPDEPHRALEPV